MSSMALMTSLSRVFGLLRTVLFAALFGTTRFGDAFLFVYKFPNLFRRFFAEGSMSAGFIPVFSKLRYADDRENSFEAQQFFNKIFSLIFLVTTLLSTLAAVFSPWLIKLVYIMSDKVSPDITAQAALLLRLMVPYLVFVSLAAVVQGVLNTHNNFTIPAVTPVFFNLAIITAALLFYYLFPDGEAKELKAFFLTGGIVAGGIIQLILQLPWFFRLGYSIRFTVKFKNKAVLSYFKRIIPVVFSSAIYQLNTIPVDIISMSISAGAFSALFFSRRLMELPLGIIIVSLSSVILPQLSRAKAAGSKSQSKTILSRSIALLFILILPVVIYTLVFKKEIVSLLFSFGIFSRASAALTASCLKFHILTVIMIGYMKIFQTFYYAHDNTRTPALIAAATLFVNLGLSYILVKIYNLGPEGIALASLLSMSLAAVIYYVFVMVNFKMFIWRDNLLILLKSSLALLIPACLFIVIRENLQFSVLSNFRSVSALWEAKEKYFWQLGSSFMIILLVYFPILRLLGVKEFNIWGKLYAKGRGYFKG